VLSGLNGDGVSLADLSTLSTEDVANDPALIANIHTALIEDNPNADGFCPNGFICNPMNTTEIANCTRIRQLAVLWGLGDVHAGSWCPDGDDRYLNCPAGYYCAQPDRYAECPAGYYCPHKTAVPEIRCDRCGIRALELRRQMYGYLVFSAFLLAFLLYVVWHWIRRYRADLYRRLVEVSARQTLDPTRMLKIRAERQALLEQIRPKLFSINTRLAALHENNELQPEQNNNGPTGEGNRLWYKSPIFAADGRTIKFSAHKLFDMLDYNQNGYLSFDELQEILQLNPMQLQEFVKRLNELDHQPTNTNVAEEEHEKAVSRSCFVRHFLGVLQETQHFGPTDVEVEDRWNEMARGKDRVPYDSFYQSSLSQFLSDPQIHRLIKHFRAVQEELHYYQQLQSQQQGGKTFISSFIGPGGRGNNNANNARSRIVRYGGGDSSSQVSGDHQRETTFFQQTTQQYFDRRSSKYVTRDVFLEHYARLLAEVTTNLDGTMSFHTANVAGGGGGGVGGVPANFAPKPGVDITFVDLSLAVKVGDMSSNVVNHVSGRMRASTMNALMGGSGCGKTSLLNALCGRAFYGETTGKIYVNGHEASIEDHRSSMGFVPQDDIVHGALTVRENLVYSGLFSLPRGTRRSDIENLADETLANLGLSRVAHSLVGDVSRRGISGGEKKRVNVGLELMKKPAILFLDEPTSGTF
jgi:ABC-type lipoprotein export system ATPase subunit